MNVVVFSFLSQSVTGFCKGMYLDTPTRIGTGLQISRVVCDSGSGETFGD